MTKTTNLSSKLRFWPILLVSFVHGVAIIGTRALVPLRANELGATLSQIGLLASAYGFGALFLTLLVGRWAGAHGGFIVSRYGCAILVPALLLAVSPSLPVLFLAQLLTGVSFVLTILGSQSATAEMGGKGDQTANYALLTTVLAAGDLVGPPLFGFMADHWGYRIAFVGAATIAVIGIFIRTPPTLFTKGDHQGNTGVRQSGSKDIVALLRNPVLLATVACGTIVLFAHDALFTFFPLYTESLALSAGVTGLILSLRAVAQLISRPFLSGLVRQWGRMNVLRIALFGGGLCTVLMGLLTSSWSLTVVAMALGSTVGLAQPITIAMVAEVAPDHLRGLALAIRMVGTRLGQGLSPLVLGLVAGPMGPVLALWISGVILGTGTFLISGNLRTAIEKELEQASA